MDACPLCRELETERYYTDKRRHYYQCRHCDLVFVPSRAHLSPLAEKAIYDQHQNHPSDDGYRRFLSRIATPLLERVHPRASGLDFGCGPGPTLSLMLNDAGHQMALYDHYYYPDIRVLDRCYDFITATEVIEHLAEPDRVWRQWLAMLHPEGWLAIMTKLVRDVESFANWHYKNDLTHICFFSRGTFQFLAARDGLNIEFIGNDVILLRKRNHESK